MGFDFNNIVSQIPVIGGFLDQSGQKAQDQLGKTQDQWGNLSTPDLQWQNLKPQSFDPTMAQAQTVSEDPQALQAQQNVLSQMSGLSQNGLSDVDQAGYAKARQEAAQISHSGNAAALQNAQDRGISGSGLEFGMREQANQNAANAAQSADLQQAADSAKQRAMYTQAYGQDLAQVRGQNYQTQAANTNILNNFNQLNTQNKNTAGYANTQAQNQAQRENNQGQLSTQQQNYANQVTKLNGQTGANAGVAQGWAAQNAANTANRNTNTSLGFKLLGQDWNNDGNKSSGGGGGSPMSMAGGAGDSGGGAGGAGGAAMLAWKGGLVPGVAKVKGDSIANDKVPVMASPGEGIIDRDHMRNRAMAHSFIDHLFDSGMTKPV